MAPDHRKTIRGHAEAKPNYSFNPRAKARQSEAYHKEGVTMKKIINGKKYDTETARLVGEYSNGYALSDFNHVTEELYQKRTGEYFIHGEGGAMSRYAEPYPGGGWQSGERVMPISYAEAQTWVEQYLDADAYEAEFGEVSEDAAPQPVKISGQAYAMLKRRSAESGKTITALVDELLGI